MLLLLLLCPLLHSVHCSLSSFVAVSGTLVCPLRNNFTATIRLMEEDTTVNDFGAQYTRRADEWNEAFSSVDFAGGAVLSDGLFDYELEPFVQIVHDCLRRDYDEDDEEDTTSICIRLPTVRSATADFPLGKVDLTSTWFPLPFNSQQMDCSSFGSLIYATRGSRIVWLSS